MSVSGIAQSYYRNNVATTNKCNKIKAGQFYQQKKAIDESVSERTRQNASAQDIYEAFKSRVSNEYVKDNERVLSNEELDQADRQESESKTEIIVKPDGSRVLVMTMSIGGMETTMSLEISKPTKTPNENSKQGINNTLTAAKEG